MVSDKISTIRTTFQKNISKISLQNARNGLSFQNLCAAFQWDSPPGDIQPYVCLSPPRSRPSPPTASLQALSWLWCPGPGLPPCSIDFTGFQMSCLLSPSHVKREETVAALYFDSMNLLQNSLVKIFGFFLTSSKVPSKIDPPLVS